MKAYIDGSSLGNPGESGFGVVLKDSSGAVVEEAGCYIGHATNNVAEYRGLLGCLEIVESYRPETLTVYSDSELLVRQVRGEYRVKHPHLKELHGRVLGMIRRASYVFEIHHIPREENAAADGLARKAIHGRSDTATIAGPHRQSG